MNMTRSMLLAGAVMIASPALALDVSKSVETAAAPDKVWAAIGDFCGIGDWHPAVANCEPSDENGTMRRTLTLEGGGTIVEELVSRDDAAMTYTYRIVESPLPVENYESTIAVKADGEGSTVSWDGTFDAKGASDEEAAGVIEGIYDAGLKGIVDKASM